MQMQLMICRKNGKFHVTLQFSCCVSNRSEMSMNILSSLASLHFFPVSVSTAGVSVSPK